MRGLNFPAEQGPDLQQGGQPIYFSGLKDPAFPGNFDMCSMIWFVITDEPDVEDPR
jgi:hypothetical protein